MTRAWAQPVRSWRWKAWGCRWRSGPETFVSHSFGGIFVFQFQNTRIIDLSNPKEELAHPLEVKVPEGGGIHFISIVIMNCGRLSMSIGCTCGIQPHSYLRILGSWAPGEKSFSWLFKDIYWHKCSKSQVSARIPHLRICSELMPLMDKTL